MKTNKPSSVPSLQIEQVWKIKSGHLEIVGMGKLLAHYRLTADGKKPSSTKLERVSVIQEYIKKQSGKLVKSGRVAA